MSRYSFNQDDGGSLGIGWDAPMGTFFLQIDEQDDEPTVWEGSEFGQHPEPDALVAMARAVSAEVPDDLAGTLRADKAASPDWRPVEDRIADGSLRIGLAVRSEPPLPLPPTTTVRGLWQRITGK
ncbi:hypothetical protein CA235_17285 [Sphingomonas sp. ABOLF]|uniref:hypothetical protein n=1 Tax=Sphingomonas sp. ABOLF TaxID=1985879 RepID=UPI000F7DAA45|nr:hypothetical protein [Sphingomonas sp. ABOLF]RSV12417.1 hypothetical protein CA235_17285 [Sphingomonas sp. ABOLF]